MDIFPEAKKVENNKEMNNIDLRPNLFGGHLQIRKFILY